MGPFMGSGLTRVPASGELIFRLRYKCTPREPYQEKVSPSPFGRVFSKDTDVSDVYGVIKSGARVRSDIGTNEMPLTNGSGNVGREMMICCCRVPSSRIKPSTIPTSNL